MEILVTTSGKVELVKRNLRKVEISSGVNLDLKVKWCWCNRPLVLGLGLKAKICGLGTATPWP